MLLNASFNDIAKLFLSNQKVDFKFKEILRLRPVHKSKILWNRAVKDNFTNRCINQRFFLFSVYFNVAAHFNLRVKLNHFCIISHGCFIDILKDFPFALFTITVKCQPIGT